MAKTLKELAQQALDVQDACNASGVVHAFSRTMTDLWAEANASGHGTDWVNKHPIVTVYLDKLAQLNGTQTAWTPEVSAAYDAVYVIVEGGR